MRYAILKGEGPIREKIRELFTSRTRSHRRVILGPLAALVPLDRFPDIRDVEIYSWGQEKLPDTAPLAALTGRGINWVNPMHLMLYWVKSKGAVIGPSPGASDLPAEFDWKERSDLALYLDAGALKAVEEVLGPLLFDPAGSDTFSELQESCNLLWRLAEGVTAAEPLKAYRPTPSALPERPVLQDSPQARYSLEALQSRWRDSARERWHAFLAEEAEGPEGLLCFHDRPRSRRVGRCSCLFAGLGMLSSQTAP